ncbi:MAG: MFS transporter, partial [Actinobacteria bacterium]|nr:MFS transporter [Actinomycetota bacterium]
MSTSRLDGSRQPEPAPAYGTGTASGRGDRLSREILVLAGVVVAGTIMTVLDLTIVNVAIPALGR